VSCKLLADAKQDLGSEQQVEIVNEGKTFRCRRIVVKLTRPTRDQEWEIAIFTALRARQKAGGRGQKVDVTVYTRMECLLPGLAHNGSKPTDSFVTKNMRRSARRAVNQRCRRVSLRRRLVNPKGARNSLVLV